MRAITTTLFLSLAFLLPSCNIRIYSSSSTTTIGTVPPRTGPRFQQAFPSAEVLVSTTDLEATRKVLDTVPLPETKEHHDALVRTLESVKTIDSEHLVLLTEAVAIPPRLADNSSMKSVSITTINSRTFVYSRGEGKYSHVIDDLLLAGAKRLSDVGPASFGRLISATQAKKTIVALSDILLKRSDTGSTGDLESILDEITFPEMRQELCVEVLLPRGRLKGKRADVAIESMSFDSNRSNLIGAIYATLEEIDPATLTRHVKLQSFDSGRQKVVDLGAPKLTKLNGTEAVALMQTASFESDRNAILSKVIAKVHLTGTDEALAFIRTNSFDSGRKETLKTLCAHNFTPVNGDDLVAYAKIGSFDSGRLEFLELLKPHFKGGFTRSSAARLLDAFSFDSTRMRVVKLFRSELQKLSERDRRAVVKEFSMSSDREAAANLLIK